MEENAEPVFSLEALYESYDVFDSKETEILALLDRAPGMTKQEVVNALDGKLSRVTIFNVIKELNKLGLINIEKVKPNSQIHRLFFNKSNPLIIIIDKVDRLENSYLLALKRLKMIVKSQLKQSEIKEIDILTDFLFLFYVHCIRRLSFWIISITDQGSEINKDLRTRIRRLLFGRLNDMIIMPGPHGFMTTALDIYAPKSNVSLLELMQLYSKKYEIDSELDQMIKLLNELRWTESDHNVPLPKRRKKTSAKE